MPGYTSLDKENLIEKMGKLADCINNNLEKDEMVLPTVSEVMQIYRFALTTRSPHSLRIKNILNNIFINEIKTAGKESNKSNNPIIIANRKVLRGDPILGKANLIGGTIDFTEYTITTNDNQIVRLPDDINLDYVNELLYLYENDLIRGGVEFANPIYGENDIDMDIIFSDEIMRKLSITKIMIESDKILKKILYNDSNYQTYRIFFTNAFKEFSYERSANFFVKSITWEILDGLLLIQEKSNITVKTIKQDINTKYLTEENIYRPDIESISEMKINEKVNQTDKYIRKFDNTYTEKFDSLAVLPENKPLMDLWNLAKSLTIFKIIYLYKLKIVNQKPIVFVDEIPNKIKLENMVVKYDNSKTEYIPEEHRRQDVSNIIVGGVVITLLDKSEFKLIAYENKELIGEFLRSLVSCTGKLLKVCIENSEEFNKIPKIKRLLLKNEHFRLYIGKPTYTDDVLFDRFSGEYVESIYELSNRKGMIPVLHRISRAIIDNSYHIAKEKLIKFVERVIYNFEDEHKFIVILLDNYRLMNMFIRSLIENFFTQDFSDYLVDEVYKEIHNLQESNKEFSDELNRFRQLLFRGKEDLIPKECQRIENIIKKYGPKFRPKMYYYAKSRFFSFL